jgi:RNA polymerase sigma-70 factor (ECF subfamily)
LSAPFDRENRPDRAYTDITDEALYHLVRRGDLRAFDVLYKRYEVRLFGFLLRMVRNHHDAEDLFHEAFVNMLRSREVTFDRATFATWLYRIARNLALNHLRSARRKSQLPQQLPAEFEPPIAQEVIEQGERSEHLGVAVSGLPKLLAEIYRLRRAGLSYEEMAATLQIPIGTVKSRMNQMVVRLHAEMQVQKAEKE